MVRAVPLVVALAACGGSKPPPAPPPATKAPEPAAKRVPVENDEVEPEDGVTIVNAHGHMEKEAIEAGLAPHQMAMMDCFIKKVGRRRWLGGNVHIHWDIKKDGTVTKVVLMSDSDVGNWPIEKCVLDIARAATFDKPVGGDADFDIPLKFDAKGPTMPWDDERTTKAVGKQLDKLDACEKKEEPPDDVTITMYVGPHGKPLSVGFSSTKSEIRDKWGECAEKAALAWKLTDPRGTVAKVAIRYRPR